MAFELNIYSTTRQAGQSLATKKYTFVTLNSSGQVVGASATTDVPYGILQNAPGSLQPAQVMRIGVSRLVFGGSMITGANGVGTDAAGKGTLYAAGVAGTLGYGVGTVEEGVNTADLIGSVAINCMAPQRNF